MTSVRVAIVAILLAGGAWPALVSSAKADDEPIRTVYWDAAKATHGEPFEVECESGSYLVGFEGQAGAWIDHLRLVCARWNATRGKFELPFDLGERKIGQSQGGAPTREVCPVGSGIAGNYDEHYAQDEDIYVLHTLEFHCVRATDGMRPQWRKFGSTSTIDTGWSKSRPRAGCPEGYLATGIYGRSGRFVDTFFGFVCRRRPASSPVAEAKPPYGDVASVPAKWRTKGDLSSMGAGGAGGSGGADIDTGKTPPPPPPPVLQTATAKADVNVHQEASGQSLHIGIMRKGGTAEVLGHDAEKDWYQLKFNGVPDVPDGPGWVAANWLTIKP